MLLPSGPLGFGTAPEEIRPSQGLLLNHFLKPIFTDLLSCDVVFLMCFYHFHLLFTCSFISIVILLLLWVQVFIYFSCFALKALYKLFLKSTISIKFIIVIIYPGWRAAVCQRSAVLLWLQLWGQTPLIWENWIWLETTCRTQQWRSCVVFYRVQPVDWRLWGQFTDWLLYLLFNSNST